jgi:hypothetical protein
MATGGNIDEIFGFGRRRAPVRIEPTLGPRTGSRDGRIEPTIDFPVRPRTKASGSTSRSTGTSTGMSSPRTLSPSGRARNKAKFVGQATNDNRVGRRKAAVRAATRSNPTATSSSPPDPATAQDRIDRRVMAAALKRSGNDLKKVKLGGGEAQYEPKDKEPPRGPEGPRIAPEPIAIDHRPGTHRFTIGSGNSITYHAPDGSQHNLINGGITPSQAHNATFELVKRVKRNDPTAVVHVKDVNGGYSGFMEKRKRNKLYSTHTWSEERVPLSDDDLEKMSKGTHAVDYDHPDRPLRKVSHWQVTDKSGRVVADRIKTKRGARASMDRRDNAYGAYNHRIRPVFEEDEEVRGKVVEVKEFPKDAPKPLKKIIGDVTWKAQTRGNQEVLDGIQADTVQVDDRNGNGDDVFKGSKVKRSRTAANPKVPPYDHACEYEEFEPKGLHGIVEASLTRGPAYGSETVQGRHLNYHWATKHVAPPGARISTAPNGKDAILHYDGEAHHIENGAVHQSKVKYDSKPAGRTDANAGKFNVIKSSTTGTGEREHKFVSHASSPYAGGRGYTDKERDAHEFHTPEHAQNYVNVVNHAHAVFGTGSGTTYTVRPKRSAGEMKRQAAALDAAKKEHSETLMKHKMDVTHPEVRASWKKVQDSKYPG